MILLKGRSASLPLLIAPKLTNNNRIMENLIIFILKISLATFICYLIAMAGNWFITASIKAYNDARPDPWAAFTGYSLFFIAIVLFCYLVYHSFPITP